jgi:hypothetical protein
MSRDYALMLTSALTVLHRQRKFVKDNEHYRKAYKIGGRYWRRYYGGLLVGEVRIHMREGKWEQALRGVSVLGRYYRQGIILLLGGRRMQRHKLSQELRTCSEQLQTSNQEVRELRRELTKQRRQLEERAQQLRRLRRRARKLEVREQELQRRLQEVEGSGARGILKRLANIQGKPSQK